MSLCITPKNVEILEIDFSLPKKILKCKDKQYLIHVYQKK